jgi:hypothetical protein
MTKYLVCEYSFKLDFRENLQGRAYMVGSSVTIRIFVLVGEAYWTGLLALTTLRGKASSQTHLALEFFWAGIVPNLIR